MNRTHWKLAYKTNAAQDTTAAGHAYKQLDVIRYRRETGPSVVVLHGTAAMGKSHLAFKKAI